ncbi:MAG: ribosome maturation factor RimM [Pseudomonadales bacterium]|nr:ribosome maturation factor RimM [Pseudomonadales bacterium]
MAPPVVVVGVIGGPFGVKGWVHVNSYTEPPANLLSYEPWRLKRGDRWEIVDVEVRTHGNGLVARIEGLDDRNVAAEWRGTAIGVEAAALTAPGKDEYYWRDLQGLQVVNDSGDDLGRVDRLFSTPAHDVMAVTDDVGERLIPFVREVVVAVDQDGGRVVVAWEPDWV